MSARSDHIDDESTNPPLLLESISPNRDVAVAKPSPGKSPSNLSATFKSASATESETLAVLESGEPAAERAAKSDTQQPSVNSKCLDWSSTELQANPVKKRADKCMAKSGIDPPTGSAFGSNSVIEPVIESNVAQNTSEPVNAPVTVTSEELVTNSDACPVETGAAAEAVVDSVHEPGISQLADPMTKFVAMSPVAISVAELHLSKPQFNRGKLTIDLTGDDECDSVTECVSSSESRNKRVRRRRHSSSCQSPPCKRQRAMIDQQHEAGGASSSRTHANNYEHNHKKLDTIDLTNERDNDISVTLCQSTNSPEICYGLVEDVIIHAIKTPTPPKGIPVPDPHRTPAMKVQLRVRFQHKQVVVFDSTRTAIGVVEQKFATAMYTHLASGAPLRFVARIKSEPKRVNEVPGQTVQRDYRMQVTVYGPRSWAKPFGRALLNDDFHLRQPSILETGIKYENPQAKFVLPMAVAGPVWSRSLCSEGILRTDRQFTGTASDNVQYDACQSMEIQKDVLNIFDALNGREDLAETEPSVLIKTRLLKHQKQALTFMCQREKPVDYDDPDLSWIHKLQTDTNGRSQYVNMITKETTSRRPPDMRGGILADEMGLGKTLTILSLCASTVADAAVWAQQPVVQHPSYAGTSEDAANANTHNAGRGALTRVELHAKSSLLVCPLSTIQNWEEQVASHVDPTFKVYTYHGPSRTKDINKLAQFDLIITTYSTAAADLTNYTKNGIATPPLERIGWFRIILDEAHQIRQPTTNNFKAMVRLTANRRWAATGTPIQNKLDDLAALFSFLRLAPFLDPKVFYKHIILPFRCASREVVPALRLLVDSVTIRRMKNLITLPVKHDRVVELDFTPAERADYEIFAADAKREAAVMMRSGNAPGGSAYIMVLQAISRMRKICAYGVAGLNESEKQILEGRTAAAPISVDSDEESSAPASSRASKNKVLESLQLMRDAGADLCILCQRRIGLGGSSALNDDGESVLCYLTACVNIVCPACFSSYLGGSAYGSSTCVDGVSFQEITTCMICSRKCSTTLLTKKDTEGFADSVDGDDLRPVSKRRSRPKRAAVPGVLPHTKTRQLVKDLLESNKWSAEHPSEAPEKSVVFSNWTTHLDLIEPALTAEGIVFTRLDGTMTLRQRTVAITQFREDNNVRVILVSIYAGGLGLNLVAGNRVYVMEPQWNPQVEAQAVDRVHRLGQTREVYVTRYIMARSFEQKVQTIQNRKRKIADLSMDGAPDLVARGKMSKQDMIAERLREIRDLF